MSDQVRCPPLSFICMAHSARKLLQRLRGKASLVNEGADLVGIQVFGFNRQYLLRVLSVHLPGAYCFFSIQMGSDGSHAAAAVDVCLELVFHLFVFAKLQNNWSLLVIEFCF